MDESKNDRSRLDQITEVVALVNRLTQNHLSAVGLLITVTMFVIAIAAPVIAPFDPTVQFDAPVGVYNPVPPGTDVISPADSGRQVVTAYLGTDYVGRDILSRILFGLRTLLWVSTSTVFLAISIGTTAGAIAGYYGDTLIDDIIMRAMDVLFSFPSILLAIAVVGVLGADPIQVGPVALPGNVKIIVAVAIAYTPRFARVMRGATLQEVQKEYVTAAKATGASDYRILRREILINTVPVVVVQGTMYMGTVILTVAALSFLGFGLQPPTPSLGLMLSNSRNYIYTGQWWYSVFPGVTIMMVILGFNLLGDALRDTLDPKYTEETIE